MSAPYTGQGLDRVDGRLKVTGKAVYSAEIPVANVVYAVIVGSTIARGRVVSLDAREALHAPGVLTVLTPANAPKLPGTDAKATSPVDRTLQVLQDDLVHYDGQPIALVLADTLERATYAASLVGVRYETTRPQVDLEEEAATAFTPANPISPPDTNRGDFDVAFKNAEVRIEQTYSTPHENHNPMEPHATVAVWQGDDRLTLYDSTQGIFEVQRKVAAMFDMPRENIRVISHFIGGGFGCKGSTWSHVILAAMGARVTGRAVKLVLTRPQMFLFVGYRPRTVQHVALGARFDGTLTATRHRALSLTSRIDEFMEPSAVVSRMLYACPNVRTSHRLVRLDVSTPTFQRAPGWSSGSFALESAMDELSYALKIDPLELRLRNYAETDPNEDKPFSSKALRECYQQAAARFGWEKRNRAERSTHDGSALLGWGMASAAYPAHQAPASALARVRRDGTALVVAGSQDIGTGTYTIMTQIAADALAMPIEKVRFDLGDTIYPETPGSGGSRTAASAGSAVRRACEGVRARLAQLAVGDDRSPLFRLNPNDLDVENATLFAKGEPGKKDTFAAILDRRGQNEIEEKVEAQVFEARKNFSTYSFGAHFVEVRVDPDLRVVRVSRMVSAFAAGKILNAKTARSQFFGGVTFGLGMALEEHTLRDVRTGRVVTRDLADYHVPVNADVPDIDIIMVDEEDPYVDVVGAKGIGELGVVGSAAAIANAIYHATGMRIRDLPITVDKLL